MCSRIGLMWEETTRLDLMDAFLDSVADVSL